ncbi:MAG: ATP-dependent protease [Actinomycetia bacterium]|nr:ATP-dependent protease [Actinomycetes bacterium]
MPMFPLGAVLFPTMVMPLHVFEPRYRRLMADCMAGDRRFGVTLIERGSEVGGGDVRSPTGTVARIAEARQLDDGRWALVAVGTERIRVQEWLPDDPYPRAGVEAWPDSEPESGPDSTVGGRYAQRYTHLRRLLALATEMGIAGAPSTLDLSDDPSVGSWQLAASAPLGQFDRQRLLAAPTVDERLDLLGELLDEADLIRRGRLEPETDGGPQDGGADEDDSRDTPGPA